MSYPAYKTLWKILISLYLLRASIEDARVVEQCVEGKLHVEVAFNDSFFN